MERQTLPGDLNVDARAVEQRVIATQCREYLVKRLLGRRCSRKDRIHIDEHLYFLRRFACHIVLQRLALESVRQRLTGLIGGIVGGHTISNRRRGPSLARKQAEPIPRSTN